MIFTSLSSYNTVAAAERLRIAPLEQLSLLRFNQYAHVTVVLLSRSVRHRCHSSIRRGSAVAPVDLRFHISSF